MSFYAHFEDAHTESGWRCGSERGVRGVGVRGGEGCGSGRRGACVSVVR